MSGAASRARLKRCIFSPIASFSSPICRSSARRDSSALLFSRKPSIWRSESGMARPPCGWGTVISASMSA